MTRDEFTKTRKALSDVLWEAGLEHHTLAQAIQLGTEEGLITPAEGQALHTTAYWVGWTLVWTSDDVEEAAPFREQTDADFDWDNDY